MADFSKCCNSCKATETSQKRKITTAVGKAKRPEGMQRINEMKRNYAILAMMAMMIIMSAGCRAQKETPAAAHSSSVQSSLAQTETAENSEEVIDTEQLEQSSEIGTSSKPIAEEDREESKAADEETEGVENTMQLLIGETEVPVTWEKNESVKALQDLCPLTIQMSKYGGFEQVGPIGQNIVREDEQTVTDSGDIVLYSGNQIVIFYGSNSWAYTRLGHIDLSEQEMRDLLGGGDVTITLE